MASVFSVPGYDREPWECCQSAELVEGGGAQT